MRVSDYLMEAIAEAGVDCVFLLPGGGAMHLNDALFRQPRLRAVPCHHEQACGIAAEAFGRVRGTFGVALVTTGPGATNAITPVTGAWIESVPLLVLSGQVKRSDRINGRGIRQGGAQEVDIVEMVRPIVKYAATVLDPAEIPHHFQTAMQHMLEGRKGPVWLDIPLDVQASEIEASAASFALPIATRAQPDEAALDEVVRLLESASRPLLLLGHGVRLANASHDAAKLVDALKIPVVTTWNALDILPWSHPQNLGRPGAVALRAPNFAVQSCDLLIAIGCRLDNVVTAYDLPGFAPLAQRVVVDVDDLELARFDSCKDRLLRADAGSFISALLSRTISQPCAARTEWIERCSSWKQRYSINSEKPFASQGQIGHYQFVDALGDVLPEDILVSTGSSGLAVEAFYSSFRNKKGQRVFLTSGLGAMGYGLPAAIGSCLASGGLPMVALESDGSLQLNVQELATLKAHALPIALFILDNAGYCSIRNTQRNYFESRYIGTGPESGLFFPDLKGLAAAYDFPFLSISDPSLLPEQLVIALSLPRPCIIQVHLDPNESLFPKVAAIPLPTGGMASMPLEDMSPLLSAEQLGEELRRPLSRASLIARGISVP